MDSCIYRPNPITACDSSEADGKTDALSDLVYANGRQAKCRNGKQLKMKMFLKDMTNGFRILHISITSTFYIRNYLLFLPRR